MLKSILSEYDIIQSWLNTPKGYYVDKPDYGNNLYILVFKNEESIRPKLHDILDKIELDLGIEVANTVDEIVVVRIDDFDKFKIVIRYNFEMFAVADINPTQQIEELI